MVAFAPLVTFFSLLRVAECDSFSQGRRNQQKKKMDLTWWLPVMSTHISKMGFNCNQRYLSMIYIFCIYIHMYILKLYVHLQDIQYVYYIYICIHIYVRIYIYCRVFSAIRP